MSAATVRKLAIVEPVSLFVLIMAYIWVLRFRVPGLWLAILAVMLLSHRLRRERAGMLGFDTNNLRACLRELAPALTFLALAMLACGMLLDSTRPIGADQALMAWAAYLPWGLFQQYILNGYFMNRFAAVLPRRAAPVVAAALFSGAHTPNWFLMAVAFAAGYCCARIYRRYRNLYFLGLAHATVGFLLFLVVPDSVSHHLMVGPGLEVREARIARRYAGPHYAAARYGAPSGSWPPNRRFRLGVREK
ncbi:MAG: CPBP family intramembrane metalloprotease [Acidobacteriia bacterium]|nr:CPBP family intramembrane metalloprotease [Terriglobia bacterium]